MLNTLFFYEHKNRQLEALDPMSSTRQTILNRFTTNLYRARMLISTYEVAKGKLNNIASVSDEADTLRAAVVMLHASMEDALRSIAVWKYPYLGADVLDQVPLVGISEIGRPTKFNLGALVEHRDMSVHDLIRKSVEGFANTFTIGSVSDICRLASQVGVSINEVKYDFPSVAEMIERRHQIVHHADIAPELDGGLPPKHARSIDVDMVERWISAAAGTTDRFIRAVPSE